MIKKISLTLLLVSSPLLSYVHFRHPTDILPLAAQYLPADPVILDAGAYDGGDTITMFNFFGKNRPHNQTKIYCFEPIPYIKGCLDRRVALHKESIITFPFALSNATDYATMYVSEEPYLPNVPSMSSSLLAPKEHLKYSATLFKSRITVPTITIDEWAELSAVDHIDLLWLDLQGGELQALKAAPTILKTVKVILTEVEFVEAYEGQPLFPEIKSWLEEQGFTMVAENFGEWASWFGDALFIRL